MAMYMQIQGIDGDVTSKNYQNWINLEGFDFSVLRKLNTQPGRIADREGSRPSVSEVVIQKRTDKSSPLLFSEACTGVAKPTVKIVFCTTSGSLSTYLEYTLSNVIISGYKIDASETTADGDHSGTHGQYPQEIVTLNFDKIEMKFTPYDDKHKAQSPIPAGYDLKQAAAT